MSSLRGHHVSHHDPASSSSLSSSSLSSLAVQARQRRFSSPHALLLPPSLTTHPANMDVHLHPLAEHATPLGLKHMELNLGGFHVQLTEDAPDLPSAPTTLVAAAFDPNNGHTLVDQAHLSFHPPISSTNLASATTAAAAAAAARSPSVTMWPSPNIADIPHQSAHSSQHVHASVMRKRKRSVGSASSLGLDAAADPMPLSLSSPLGLPSAVDTMGAAALSAMELTPTSSVFPSGPVSAGPSTVGAGSTVMFARPRSPLAPVPAHDRMDVDAHPAADPAHMPTTMAPTSKPVKKRVKSIEANNANLAFISPSTSLSTSLSMATNAIHLPAAALPTSALLHTASPAPHASAATGSGETPPPPFPPSPIHSPSHLDTTAAAPSTFCDNTPPGSGAGSPLTNRAGSLPPTFGAAPMTPADEPPYLGLSGFSQQAAAATAGRPRRSTSPSSESDMRPPGPRSVSSSSARSSPSSSPTRAARRRPTLGTSPARAAAATSGYAPAAAPLARLHSLPHWVAHLDDLPDPLVHYALFQLLRRCSVTTLQFVHGIVAPALKRDFLALLPYEIASNILQRLDCVSLCRSAKVSRRWRMLIDSDPHLWRTLGARDGYWAPDGTLPQGGSGSMLRVRSMYQIARIQMARHEPLTKEIAPDLLPFLDPASVRRIVDNLECYLDPRDVLAHVGAHPFKAMYARGRTLQSAWMSKEPKRIHFTGHGSAVVTCLQFDEDKVVSGSDDQTICVYDIRTGALRRRLDGHEGGVWALQYVGNTLVSGSTDRTVRVWDLATGKTTHVFHGHTSTVRCLQLLLPVPEPGKRPPAGTVHLGTPYKGGYISSATYIGHAPTPKLKEPLIVTGSRDTHVRVWRLPEPTDPVWPPSLAADHDAGEADEGAGGDEPRTSGRRRSSGKRTARHGGNSAPATGFAIHGPEASTTPCNSAHDLPAMPGEASSSSAHHHPSANPYFRHVLAGHAHSVRALAGHGHIVCSGSYDSTVRVWDVVEGTCMWQLTGHTTKVYSIVYDGVSKCWSGSMDATVRCWDVHTGQCLAVLEGHSSLVGLLELSPQWLVSAAADSSLRVWNTDDSALVHTLQAHSNAITCFHFDGHKVVSGSEGAIKLWNPHTGKVVRDLVTNVANVWRLQVNERWCVAAVNRESRTEFIVLDFDPGVDCPAFDGTVPFTPTAGGAAGGGSGSSAGGQPPPPPQSSHGPPPPPPPSSHPGGLGGADDAWPTGSNSGHRASAGGSLATYQQHLAHHHPAALTDVHDAMDFSEDDQSHAADTYSGGAGNAAATAGGAFQHHRYHPYAAPPPLGSASASASAAHVRSNGSLPPGSSTRSGPSTRRHSSSAMAVDEPLDQDDDTHPMESGSPMLISSPAVPPPPTASAAAAPARASHHGRGASASSTMHY